MIASQIVVPRHSGIALPTYWIQGRPAVLVREDQDWIQQDELEEYFVWSSAEGQRNKWRDNLRDRANDGASIEAGTYELSLADRSRQSVTWDWVAKLLPPDVEQLLRAEIPVTEFQQLMVHKKRS